MDQGHGSSISVQAGWSWGAERITSGNTYFSRKKPGVNEHSPRPPPFFDSFFGVETIYILSTSFNYVNLLQGMCEKTCGNMEKMGNGQVRMEMSD